MKIRSIVPILVSSDEMERRQSRYNRISPPGISVELENLSPSLNPPRELANEEQIRHSEEIESQVASATDASKYNAVMPDCVLDPAVTDLDRKTDVTVIGITRAAAHVLAALGQRFGVITRNAAIGNEYRRVIERYGLASHFDDIYVLDLAFEDVANDEKWNAAIRSAARKAKAKGVRILINGCSAVEVMTNEDVKIVDPTALALKTVAFGVDCGILSATSTSN